VYLKCEQVRIINFSLIKVIPMWIPAVKT
jgi:hypothetical protein